MVASILIKLVLMPAISLPLIKLASDARLLPDEPMLLIVLMIESAAPSAQTALALLAATGQPHLAEELSAVYVPQYVCSVVSMAIVIVLAVELIG